eukprot:GILJ01003371.1.p1 GENE.GILJ01003371.1~~GILJ01003371.1.p1  ORF type:complete len:344 (+),score=62.63 GILJ01003371.1:40-1071(+)
MSSLAAARADNFYYPPGWTPDQGSINKYQKSHPLGKRAAKIDQGILVIRFEMPFNVWCEGCEHLIGKGVRFNAEKKCVGNYFSTKIWEFGMKCPACSKKIVVKTDPKSCEYIITEGARRKVEEWAAEDSETIDLSKIEEESAKRAVDAMYNLERDVEDKEKAATAKTRLTRLQDVQEAWKDDYDVSRLLRKKFREEKKEIKKQEEIDKQPKNFVVPLLPGTTRDALRAARVFSNPETFRRNKAVKMDRIKAESIFGSKTAKEKEKLKALEKKRLLQINHKLFAAPSKNVSADVNGNVVLKKRPLIDNDSTQISAYKKFAPSQTSQSATKTSSSISLLVDYDSN